MQERDHADLAGGKVVDFFGFNAFAVFASAQQSSSEIIAEIVKCETARLPANAPFLPP